MTEYLFIACETEDAMDFFLKALAFYEYSPKTLVQVKLMGDRDEVIAVTKISYIGLPPNSQLRNMPLRYDSYPDIDSVCYGIGERTEEGCSYNKCAAMALSAVYLNQADDNV